jgi:murein DD-endopeptidase MepM/ murein hydrolase activator NlpD
MAWSLSTTALELQGALTQGSLLRGQLPAGSQLWLNQQPVDITSDGWFALGFGRDALLEHELSWQKPGEKRQSRTIQLMQREYRIQHIDGLPAKMVSPPEAVLTRIRQDSQQVSVARKLNEDRSDFSQSFIWPVTGRISGVYGSQRVLNGQPKRPHFGVDVAAATGTPVYAPADGKVTLFVADMYYSGGTMIIDHGLGVSSTFLHLHKSHVKVGEVVNQGQLVGEVGSSGRSTGPHLDWRMNWFKERIDPTLLVPYREGLDPLPPE